MRAEKAILTTTLILGALIQTTREAVSFSVGVTGQEGGQNGIYQFLVVGDNIAEFDTNIKSLRIILPSDYNMGNGLTLTCVGVDGFTADPACSTTAQNVIAVNFDNAEIGSKFLFIFQITNVINPLVETGPGGSFSFTYEFKNGFNGGGSLISTTDTNQNLNFNSPAITAVTLTHTETTVWTNSNLRIKLNPSYKIVTSSKILLQIPPAYNNGAADVPYIQLGYSCNPITNADPGTSCNYDAVSKTISITGLFSSDLNSGTEVEVEITNFFTPISTSPYDNFNVYIATSDDRRYMSKLNLAVKVDNAKDVSAFSVRQAEKAVGLTGTLIWGITFSAWVESNYWVEFRSSDGLDLSNSLSIGFNNRGTPTATQIQLEGGTLNYQEMTFILAGVKNRDWVEDSSISMNIYDGNGNIAQKTALRTLSFIAASIDTMTVQAVPNSLGTDTEINLTWTSKTDYPQSAQVTVTTPSQFQKLVINDNCLNDASPIACQNTGDVITLTGVYTGQLTRGSETILKIPGIRLPYCAADSSFAVNVQTASNQDINAGTIIMSTGSLSRDVLTFQSIVPSTQVAGRESSMTLEFAHAAVLKADSRIVFTLDPAITWITGSACSIASGLDGASVCTQSGSTLTIANGIPTARTHGGVNIVVQLNNIGNPRAIGSYNIDTKIETTDGAICQYAAGQATFSITSVDNITATIVPAVNNRNLYTSYRVTVESISANWVNTDFVEVVLPADANMGISDSIDCTTVSTNLVSVTCVKTSANIIKVNTNVNAANYATDKNLVFDIKFIQNPDVQGTKTGFEVHIKTQDDRSFVMDTQIDVIYAGYVVPTLTSIQFSSDRKGDDSYATFNAKVDAYVPQGGEFEVEFVDASKFVLLANETLRASTPSLAIQSTSTSAAQLPEVYNSHRRGLIDTVNRKIRVASNADIQPNTDVSFEINMRNPLSNTISGPDVIMRLLLNNKIVFENEAVLQQFTFVCDPLCLECDNFWYTCTRCIAGKVLSGNSCVDATTETVTGNSIPFLFTILALLLFLAVWIFGKCWRNRNFSGNFYYALLRFIYFPALIGITVFFYINQDPKLYTYLMLGVIFIHIILSWVSARSFRTVYRQRAFGGCQLEGVPVVGKPAPLFFTSAKDFIFHKLGEALSRPKERDPEYIKMVGEKKEKGCLFKTYSSQVFMILFNAQVTRVFFSSTASGKTKKERKCPVTERALFWTWDQESYRNLKRSYSKHRNYYMFFQFLIVILLVFSCLGIGETQAYIYLFKFDLGLLTLIDILAYTYAYNELNPRKKKKGSKKNPLVSNQPDEEDQVIMNKEDNPNVIRDKNGKIIGTKAKDGLIYDKDGNILERGEDGKIYVKDKDGNIIAYYDKEGNKFDRFGNKIEEGPDGKTKVFNKKGEHIASFDKEGNLIDPKTGKVLMSKDEYQDMIDQGYKMNQDGLLYNPQDGWYYDPETGRKFKLGKKGERLYLDPKTGKLYIDGKKKGEKIFYDPETGIYYKLDKKGNKILCKENGKPLSKKEIEKLIENGKIKLDKNGNPIILNKLNTKLKDPSLASRLEKDDDGVYRPKLLDQPDFRKGMVDDPKITKKLIDSVGESKAKSKIFDDRTDNIKYDMDGSNADGKLKSNMVKDEDLARRNAKFDKWWYTADKNYLEIIYEEDVADNQFLYENPDYDNKKLDRLMNNKLRPDGKALGNDSQRDDEYSNPIGIFKNDKIIINENEDDTENTKDAEFKYDSVTKENAMGEDKFMDNRKIGTIKNQDARNNSQETINDMVKTRALCDRNGYFIGADGKKYRFDKNHNMIEKEEQDVVPLVEVPQKIGDQNVDNVPNVLRKYRSEFPPVESNEKGEFIANDGKVYHFDTQGNLVDKDGEVVPYAQGKNLTRDLNVDDVENCPNKYKLDLVRPIVEKDGTFYANDGKPYQFDDNGNMYDSSGRQLSEPEILEKIEGLDIDYVPNCPAKFKAEPAIVTPKKGGKFIGNDGKVYKFSPEGSLIDEHGNEIPPDQAKIILHNLDVDHIPNVPDRFKTDEKRPRVDEDGHFIGNDGEKYMFDDYGNLVDEDGNIVPKHKADSIVSGLNLDHIDNTPNEYRIEKKPEAPIVKRDGAFLGADGKNYKFDRNGNLIDEDGNIVPNDEIPFILDGLIVDNVPNCPDHLKNPKDPEHDSDGYFVGADGKKYRFDPNGQLVDENGKPVPEDKIHSKLDGIDFRKLPNAPTEAQEGDPRISSKDNPFGTLRLEPGDPRAPSRFRQSDANYTRLGSVTVDSQKERLTNPHMGDTMYVNLLADESFDLDINVEEIEDDDYNPENEQIYAQPFLKQYDEGDFDGSKDVEDRNSRLADIGMRNINSRSSLSKPKKKQKNNLITKGRRIDTRNNGSGSINKNIHQPRLGYRDSLTSTLRGNNGESLPRKHARRAGPRSAMGVDLRKKSKKKKRKGKTRKDPLPNPQVRKNDSSSSFGTFMLNQLDKKRGRTSGIGFIKPYRRQQMNKTTSNMGNDKLLDLKQIYIDNIEKEKSKNPYSRSHSRANLHNH